MTILNCEATIGAMARTKKLRKKGSTQIGQYISAARSRQQFSAAKLGKLAGLSGMQVGRIERGYTASPSIIVVQRIVDALDDRRLREQVRALFA